MPPNIVFFLTDDQRFDTIAALGNKLIRTPNLDRLVARGVSFTRAHIPGGTSGAVCMPSRAMLLTGRTLFHLDGSGQTIPDDHVLLGEHLRHHGYRTFGTGKWHNSPQAFARSFSDGAEIFFGGMEDHWNVPACNFDPTGRYEQRAPKCRDPFSGKRVGVNIADHVHAGRHSSELFADATIDFLDGYDGLAPFFAYVSLMAPHDPRIMPEVYRAMYRDDDLPLPPSFLPAHPFDTGALRIRDEMLAPFPRTPQVVREHLADYYAMITHLDAQVGRVIDALERNGQLDNTLIVFAGDNGLALGQHGLFGKQSLYDHSVRVPLIFAGAGIPQGEQRHDLVYLLDIYPTLCDLLGIDAPKSVEGESLLSAIRGEAGGGRDTLYLAYVTNQRGVTNGQHKLIEYHVEGQRHTQLFDLEQDPWETRNLAEEAAHAPTRDRLRNELKRLRAAWDDQHSQFGEPFWAGVTF